MTLVATLASAVAVYLVAGAFTGNLPSFTVRSGRQPPVSERQQWLLQAGADLTPRQFMLGSFAVGITTFALVLLLTATPAAALVPAVAVALLPRAWFSRERARRMREIQEAWPDGIRDLVASISAGLSLNQAVVGLSRRGPEPLQRAFARYPSLARIVGVTPALEMIKEELADPTSDRVLEVLVLAHEKGGQMLTQILHDLATAATRDVHTVEEITTQQLEQKINARAVFVLPWLVLLLLTIRGGYFREFYRSPAGVVVVTIGAACSLLGLWVVTRLGREPVEERVLGGAASTAGGRVPSAEAAS